ncbi:MAG: ABC transporter substrate-binding protein, partial [Candidatus Paceibacterota bacterium]
MNWLNKNTLIIIVAVILVVAGYFGWSSSPAKGDGFIIGATLPLTGAAQIYGQYNKEGMDLALLDINRQGGINGKKLSIIYDDTGSQNTNAVSAITKMININKVPVIFGSPPSSEVLAEAPIAEKNRTVLIVAGGGVPSLRDAGDYIFRVKVSVDKEIEELKKLATNVFRAKTAYILYIQNDYGEGTRKFVSQIFPQSGIAVLGSEGFGADEGDYRSALIKAQKTNPDVIVISGWPKNLGLILKQAKELGLKKQFIASVG